MVKICNGNKIHDLDYDLIRHWIHLNLYLLDYNGISVVKRKINMCRIQWFLDL